MSSNSSNTIYYYFLVSNNRTLINLTSTQWVQKNIHQRFGNIGYFYFSCNQQVWVFVFKILSYRLMLIFLVLFILLKLKNLTSPWGCIIEKLKWNQMKLPWVLVCCIINCWIHFFSDEDVFTNVTPYINNSLAATWEEGGPSSPQSTNQEDQEN